jgi:hypothetical protein
MEMHRRSKELFSFKVVRGKGDFGPNLPVQWSLNAMKAINRLSNSITGLEKPVNQVGGARE